MPHILCGVPVVDVALPGTRSVLFRRANILDAFM